MFQIFDILSLDSWTRYIKNFDKIAQRCAIREGLYVSTSKSLVSNSALATWPWEKSCRQGMAAYVPRILLQLGGHSSISE